jgi:Alpha-L-arabinofuranosidase B, catalytic
MRKLLTFLIALAEIVVAVYSPVSAQGFNGGGFNVGIGPFAAGGALVLDGITTGIKAAYSTRKLLTAYAGNAIQVQETTGNTTTNIGFVANVLDTASLSTFCSGKTCKVITWYDQSGGGFNQTQGTIANAPIIYQSGAVNFINSTRPAVLFVGATPTTLANASLSTNPVNTLFQNFVENLTNATDAAMSAPTGAGGLEFQLQAVNTLKLTSPAVADVGISTGAVTRGTASVVESQYNSTTGAFAFWIDGASAGSGTNAMSLSAGTVNIGNDGFGDHVSGSIGEIIMYDLVGGIPSGSRTSIEANQKTYWGTP